MGEIFVDPVGGVAGDMLLAALLDAGADEPSVRRELASLRVEGWQLFVEETTRRGFRGRTVRVETDPDATHPHRTPADIVARIEASAISRGAKERALRIFGTLARAEAHVHGIDVERVHFHEVGAIDSIVDIVGIAIALDALDVDTIRAGVIPLGQGTTHGAHGEFPLPAPATAALLDGWPVRFTGRAHEHTTPTGAAVLAALATPGVPPVVRRMGRVGVGFGTRVVEEGPPNLVRVFRLDACEEKGLPGSGDGVDVVETAIDDMSPEWLAVFTGELFEAGAIDVHVAPIQMKKGRPGFLVTALAPAGGGDALATTFLTRSSTLGVRIRTERRVVLERRIESVETAYGPVRVKVAETPDGRGRVAAEADDVRLRAQESGATFGEVAGAAEAAFRQSVTRSDPPT